MKLMKKNSCAEDFTFTPNVKQKSFLAKKMRVVKAAVKEFVLGDGIRPHLKNPISTNMTRFSAAKHLFLLEIARYSSSESVFFARKSCSSLPKAIFEMGSTRKEASHWVRGFTLIELVVSASIFIIIATVAVGGFVGALRAQRQVAALIAANNNVSLALEQMAREIRTGRNFCEPSCTTLNSGKSFSELTFINERGECIAYRKSVGGVVIERGVSLACNSTYDFQPITGQNAFVWSLDFFLSGQGGAYDPLGDDSIVNQWPTRVTVAVRVSANEKGISEGAIRLQTTVSSRQPDN
ncbi:MAG: hypothetical protein A3J67_06150 [Parcubacteria group bacterium RIFCSPHIGHO2_02_FULL_48_10b]|nr:MAG: hypothetical protein A3J67_06150 [Parcubacteria group bacterium RIFCSPHIGHO2_02_FULL_48_10b]